MNILAGCIFFRLLADFRLFEHPDCQEKPTKPLKNEPKKAHFSPIKSLTEYTLSGQHISMALQLWPIFSSHASCRGLQGIKSVPSVCLSVRSLMAEPFDTNHEIQIILSVAS